MDPAGAIMALVSEPWSSVSSQGPTFLPPPVSVEIIILLYSRIELYFPSPSSSILLTFTFPPLAPSPPPPAGRQPRAFPLRRAATARARDGRQIKTALFPLCSSHHPRLNLRFLIFFLIFPFSLEIPGITWNQTLSQLDAGSFLLFQSLSEFEGWSFSQEP